MYKKSYEVDALGNHAGGPAQQTGVEEYVLTDEFSVIPAYKEVLPDGLISDEI